MIDIQSILKSLGLLDSEIKIYLAAFKNGAGSVLELSKQTKLSRQAAYVAVEELIQRGLMSSSVVGKKRFYVAEHPAKLLAYAKRKNTEMEDRIKELERLIPKLELEMGGDRPVVRIYEGKEGIRAIIEDMKSSTAHEMHEITDVSAMYHVLSPADLETMRLELKRRGVDVKGLYAGEGATQNIVRADRYILPAEDSGFQSHIGIDGNTIQLVTFKDKMISVIIDSEALANALRVVFKFAFEGAKKLPKR